MSAYPRTILKKGKEKPVLRGHPWVFSGAVGKVEGEVSPGDVVEVYSAEGQFLGVGHINPHSQIFLRLLTHRKEALSADFFKARLLAAASSREIGPQGKTDAYRIVNGEGDFLPGLVVDRYGDVFVLQFLTAGMDRLKGLWVDLLVKEFHPQSLYERSDVVTRKEEGLSEASGLLYGQEVPDWLDVVEHGCRFKMNVKKGQKTGFYLDQRENRFALQGFSRGKKILDCFCYTGGFSVHAAFAGADEITLIDSSREALNVAEEQFNLNHLENVRHLLIHGDAFDVMRDLKDKYDLIILDPPSFAKKKSHIPGAARGYKDLNLQAFRLLKREGLLFTFSCSHHVSWDLFQKIVFSAAVDAGRRVQLIGRRGHPIDHPVDLCHPEGEYLKGLVCRVF